MAPGNPPPNIHSPKARALTHSFLRYALLMAARGSQLLLKFGLTFYLARTMDLQALGVFGLVVGATLVVPTLVRAGLTSTLTRMLVNATPSQTVDAVRHYLVWVIACYGAMVALWGLLSTSALGFSVRLPLPLHLPVYPALVLLVIFAEHLAADLALLFSNLYRTSTANMLGLVQAASWIVPFCVSSYCDPSLLTLAVLLGVWALGTCMVVVAFSLLLHDFPWRSAGKVSAGWYGRQLAASAYLYVSDLTGTLAQFADRYLIAAFISMEHAGVYLMYFQLSNAVYTLVSSSVVSSHRPGVLSAFQKGQLQHATDLLHALQWRALASAVVVASVVGLAFHVLAPFLNRPLVLQYLPLMWLIFAVTIIKLACLTSFIALFARQLDAHLLLFNLAILALVGGLSLAGMTWLGLYAMPLASGIAYLVTLLLIHRLVALHSRRALA